MKKIIGWILIIILSIGSLMIVKEKNELYSIADNYDNIEVKIKYKGLRGAVDFISLNDNIYIAYPNMINCIERGKEPYSILKDETLNISSIEAVESKIYFISNSMLMSIDTKNMSIEKYITSLPNTGDFKDVYLKSYNENLFITLGAMTNSGIVGEDNKWIESNKAGHDLTPETIIVNESLKGAYVTKGNSNKSGQIIKQSPIGNSSILIFDTKTNEFKTFAWGIRNVNGIDITDEGKVYASVGGYEPRGERPVYNDSDYIFEIKKGHWYGFPDYSGGDSLQSPRFNFGGNTMVKMILSEIPMNPPAPYYQHSDLNCLSWLAIDNTGKIANNNERSIFLYNKVKNSIYCGIIGGVFDNFITLNNECRIDSMKIIKDELYILDSRKGVIFSVNSK